MKEVHNERNHESPYEKVFPKRVIKYNLPNCRITILPNPKTNKYDTDTVVYKANQIWSTLPARYKNMQTFDLVKPEIKKLELWAITMRCTYRLITSLAVFEICCENFCC